MAANTPDWDSDEDVEFEDVLHQEAPVLPPSPQSDHAIVIDIDQSNWVTGCHLPDQQAQPFAPGSYEEDQLRALLETGLESINSRHQKVIMGMPFDPENWDDNPFRNFSELSGAVERLVDILWGSATTSVSVEGFLALAGILTQAIHAYEVELQPMLGILKKFDVVFEALCTGINPTTGAPLPQGDRPHATQLQKMRMRGLAVHARSMVYSVLFSGSDSSDEMENDFSVEDDPPSTSNEPWWMAVNKIFERTLMLLGEMD